MASVTFVKKAMKDYPDHGIKKGESYYWWKFRFGGKHYSRTPPRQSQLTQSEFWGTVWGTQEGIDDEATKLRADHAKWSAEHADDLSKLAEHIATEHGDDSSACDPKECESRPEIEEFPWSDYSAIEDAKSQMEDLSSECDDKRSNMPDSLQDSESGQRLEERQQAADDAASELDNALDSWNDAGDDLEKRIEALEEASTAIGNISCD